MVTIVLMSERELHKTLFERERRYRSASSDGRPSVAAVGAAAPAAPFGGGARRPRARRRFAQVHVRERQPLQLELRAVDVDEPVTPHRHASAKRFGGRARDLYGYGVHALREAAASQYPAEQPVREVRGEQQERRERREITCVNTNRP